MDIDPSIYHINDSVFALTFVRGLGVKVDIYPEYCEFEFRPASFFYFYLLLSYNFSY